MSNNIKKIPVSDLIIGMYIHDINCGWMDHAFVTGTFAIDDQHTINKILDSGVKYVYIDVLKGKDTITGSGISEDVVAQEINAGMHSLNETPPDHPITGTPLNIDIKKQEALKLITQTGILMRNMFSDLRMGKQIEVDNVTPVIDSMIATIYSNQDAIMPLTRLREHDQYTFQHSVSTCTLMIAFAKGLDLDKTLVKNLAIGALLHDVGKAKIAENILNKPAKLTDPEFANMKSHVAQSLLILQQTKNIAQETLDVIGQHHERYDGSGYPNHLTGTNISLYGRMASIVDVYDAITSDRAYHKGMTPPDAMRKLFEWSSSHLDPKLVQAFIKFIGIYPTGSFVSLSNHYLGVVYEQNKDNLLHPIIKIFYDIHNEKLITPRFLDLSKSNIQIKNHEDPTIYGIDAKKWII